MRAPATTSPSLVGCRSVFDPAVEPVEECHRAADLTQAYLAECGLTLENVQAPTAPGSSSVAPTAARHPDRPALQPPRRPARRSARAVVQPAVRADRT